jgi:hypothetical protein
MKYLSRDSITRKKEKKSNFNIKNMKKNVCKVETFLPVFKGMYGNYWDDYTPYDDHGDGLPFERYEIDHKAMLESIGKSIISYLYHSTELFEKLGIEAMEYQSSYSPAFYNFSNDSINVEVIINTEYFSQYVYNNWDRYSKEIHLHHTSRDGFISFQSNDIREWEAETSNFTYFEDSEYYLGFLLDIASQIEGIEERSAYYDWCESANESDFCTIKELTWETIDLDAAFRDNLEKIDFTYGDLVFLKEDAEKRAELFSTDWIDEIEDADRIEILEGIGLSPEQFEYVNN